MKHFYKKNIILLFIFFNLATTHVKSTIVVSDFCERVHKYTYLIYRLEKPLRILSHIKQQKSYYVNLAAQVTMAYSFQHPSIVSMIEQIQKTKSIKPLFNVWSCIHSYKYVHDQLLINEFIILILILSKNILIQYIHNTNEQEELAQCITRKFNTTLKLNCNKIIDTIHLFTNALIHVKKNNINHIKFLFSLSKKTNTLVLLPFQDFNTAAQTEKCTFRYYLYHRLKKTFLLFKKLNTFKNFYKSIHQLSIDNFQDNRIKQCVIEIQQKNTIAPFLELADEFKKYCCVDNFLFLKEFLTLTFIVGKYIILEHHNRISIQQIIEVYDKINELPIEEILHAIDLITEQLPAIVEEYELNNKEISWQQWFKKYWWTLPIVAIIVGGKIILSKNNQNPSNYIHTFDSVAHLDELNDLTKGT